MSAQKDEGKSVDNFTSRSLCSEDEPPRDREDEDIIKWCANALYVGAADTVRHPSIWALIDSPWY